MATHAIHASTTTTRTRTSTAAARQRAAAELRRELPWLLLSVGTAIGAAAATSAWMIENIHLF